MIYLRKWRAGLAGVNALVLAWVYQSPGNKYKDASEQKDTQFILCGYFLVET